MNLTEFEAIARASMEPAAFDYVAGGAWDELSLHDNVAAWRRRRFRPRVLVDVSGVDPRSTFIGQPSALPIAIAPMAFQTLAHPDGEIEAARGAAAAGIPYTLSTTSSHSIEAVAAGAPGGTRWFQLYTQADPAITRSLVERAEAAGFRARSSTVDLPVLGYRDRDRRSGFVLPALGNFADVPASHGRAALGAPSRLQDRPVHRSLVWADLATIRSWSSLPLVVKGILTAEDARLAVEHGVDAIVVSNHGARQLDRVPAGDRRAGRGRRGRRRPDRGLGRRRRAPRPRHRDRPCARCPGRARRAADVLGAGGRRRGRRRAGDRDPPRGVRARAGAARAPRRRATSDAPTSSD